MSHPIYHTRGIILSSTEAGEANRYYRIFTEDYGLIGALAQSVREEKSKLRYVLQDLSFINVDLVRGKDIWRITGATSLQHFESLKTNYAQLKFFARLAALILRLVQGETPDKKLFHEIFSVADFLDEHSVPREYEFALETLIALRVLTHLGYMDPSVHEEFLLPHEYSTALVESFEKNSKRAVVRVNEALAASHL